MRRLGWVLLGFGLGLLTWFLAFMVNIWQWERIGREHGLLP